MEALKKRILKDGKVLEGDILQVSSFLNHMVDVQLLNEMGKEFATFFKDCQPTKIVTIEASGIAIAAACALELQIPFIIAKKHESLNLTGDVYSAEVFSYTKQKAFHVNLSKALLHPDDRILILDDFLAFGSAVNAVMHIIEEAQAALVGVGICIEKSYQQGGNALRSRNVNLHSLARIHSLENGVVTFL